MRQTPTEENWHQQALQAENEATQLPAGPKREALTRKSRQLKIASQINNWLSSPGLQPPE